MNIEDPGYLYWLSEAGDADPTDPDGDQNSMRAVARLRFHKPGQYPGVTVPEVLRACLDRVRTCWPAGYTSHAAQDDIANAIVLLENEMARQLGARALTAAEAAGTDADPCQHCGYLCCAGECRTVDQAAGGSC